ncbi:hypothetical protein [Cryptosporangium minutisporangium]|uniref:Secreted protein n=1 Tax=Cryptosporangium minutisporangium TaxID=113569 RepID=A0ABP6T5Y1_9ACTN
MRKQGRSGWTLGVAIGGVTLALTGAAMVGVSSASEDSETASVGQITCPDVASQLPAIPASAQAEVDRNLTLLQTQISEAQNRLESTVGQGGPNFVQNAILGPLASKRGAAIDRIAIAIGRTAARPELPIAELSTCTVEEGGAAPATTAPTTEAPAAPETSAPAADDADNGDDAADQRISCPDVESELPAIPAQAQAEVERNLALLDTQISEANNRLLTSAGEGGPNFVQNAILGPLADKRGATIDRIQISIGRHAARPELDVAALSVCSLA